MPIVSFENSKQKKIWQIGNLISLIAVFIGMSLDLPDLAYMIGGGIGFTWLFAGSLILQILKVGEPEKFNPGNFFKWVIIIAAGLGVLELIIKQFSR